MTVYETDIPGVGRKFELDLDHGGQAVVLVHHDGRRELFHRASENDDSEKLLDLRQGEAGKLAAMLQGAGVRDGRRGRSVGPAGRRHHRVGHRRR